MVPVQSIPYSPVVPGDQGGLCHLGDPEHPEKEVDSAPRHLAPCDGPRVLPWEHIRSCPPPHPHPSPALTGEPLEPFWPKGPCGEEKRGEGHWPDTQ